MLRLTLKDGFAERIFVTELSWKIRVELGKSKMKLCSDLYWSIAAYRTSSQIAFTVYFGSTYQQDFNLYLHHRLFRVARVSRHHPISLIAAYFGVPKYHGISLRSSSISRLLSLPALPTNKNLQLSELIRVP